MTDREFKDVVFDEFAKIAAAFASPKRLEIIDILSQGERDVDTLSKHVAMTVANTSRHLQILKSARLVKTRRNGVKIIYSLTDTDVVSCWKELQALAEKRSAEMREVVNLFFTEKESLEKISLNELWKRIQNNEIELLDVRPDEEYSSSHISGAKSVPLSELKKRMEELPKDKQIVAYCRGPYCVLSAIAVKLLKKSGFQVTRLEEGVFEWQEAGYPVNQIK